MPRACSYVKHSVTLCGGERRKPGTWARACLRCLWHVPQALCTAIPVPPGEACGGMWCVLGACVGGPGVTATARRLSCPPGPRGASTGCRASPHPASTPAYSRSPGLRPADASQTPIHQSPLCSHHPDEFMNGGGGGSMHAFSGETEECGPKQTAVEEASRLGPFPRPTLRGLSSAVWFHGGSQRLNLESVPCSRPVMS